MSVPRLVLCIPVRRARWLHRHTGLGGADSQLAGTSAHAQDVRPGVVAVFLHAGHRKPELQQQQLAEASPLVLASDYREGDSDQTGKRKAQRQVTQVLLLILRDSDQDSDRIVTHHAGAFGRRASALKSYQETQTMTVRSGQVR